MAGGALGETSSRLDLTTEDPNTRDLSGDRAHQDSRSLSAFIARRRVPVGGPIVGRILETRERDICNRIVQRISEIVGSTPLPTSVASLEALRRAFDEYVVTQHVEQHVDLELPVSDLFGTLHTLSEQTYENKSLTFGCLLDPIRGGASASTFPEDYLGSKKYKALSDGFRTAYHVSAEGRVLGFVDLDTVEEAPLTEKHFYPDWAKSMARVSRSGKCGIALSRQGDILIFDEGSLRFTYRYGRWQYWNHAHLTRLLRDRARAQRVLPNIVGRVVGAIYRAALDVSFRRSGGLFVILHNRDSLRDIVRTGDAIGDETRNDIDHSFDRVVRSHKIQSLPRVVAVELASLDGAVVLANSGEILAYGAVLEPRKKGHLKGTEGSRTKAAVGASKYGLAIKISSDGDIAVYHDGREFIRI